jgi:hypothetical protein
LQALYETHPQHIHTLRRILKNYIKIESTKTENMKKLIALFIYALILKTTSAQTPQIALVRPSTNQTQIFTTLQNAYIAALDNDYIYLPGGTFYFADSLNKKLNIFGAGFSVDSTLSTGKTIIGGVIIGVNGSGSHIEGIESQYIAANNYQLSLSTVYVWNFLSNLGNNSLVRYSVLEQISGSNSTTISNCIIYKLSTGNNLNVNNCVFLNKGSDIGNPFFNAVYNINNAIFRNNIFIGQNPIFFSNNLTLINNLKYDVNYSFFYGGTSNTEISSIYTNTIDEIFINYPATATNFGFQYNYNLKPTCIGINAGTDGTDVGIYGTLTPTKSGWVPSNPHIYLKQVTTQSNTNGTLPIIFKVRTNN